MFTGGLFCFALVVFVPDSIYIDNFSIHVFFGFSEQTNAIAILRKMARHDNYYEYFCPQY